MAEVQIGDANGSTSRKYDAEIGDANGSTSRKYEISISTFGKRVKLLYACWREFKQELWGGADALSIATPPVSNNFDNLKSSAFHSWLLGYEFPETIMVFFRKQMHVLCSQKKAGILQVLQRPSKHFNGLDVIIHVKSRNDDGVVLMRNILEAVVVGKKSTASVIGQLAQEAPEGSLIIKWTELLNGPGFILVDVSAALSQVLALKDISDLQHVRNTFASVQKMGSINIGAHKQVVKATLRSHNQEMTKEEVRRQHQAELVLMKNEETARRLASGGGHYIKGAVRTSENLVAYHHVDDIPFSKSLMIQVDQKNNSILLPVYGSVVPFHIATVKSITASQQDSTHSYIRIVFNVPGAGYSDMDLAFRKFPSAIYLKDVSFKSSDMKHANQVVQLIKTLRRQAALHRLENAERASLVTQEELQVAKGKPIRLSSLWITPVFGGKGRKLRGVLEAHVNGFRYTTMKPDEKVDIMYRNIKHAFFQPAEKEMITLLHFHLHNFIMVGSKKTKDVQFFVEVMEAVESLSGGKRRAYDPDEIEEEHQERARRNKINSEFNTFVKSVSAMWEHPHFNDLDLEFDVPFRELGFHGVPHREFVFIVPTVNCLVDLIQQPYLVVSLDDIELVSLERIGFGQRNFDIAIVFKDFERDVRRIDAIPSASLDGIKEWMDSLNIKYYENSSNLKWPMILKTIQDDPDGFLESGGWEFLNVEVSDSESGGSEEEDEGYEPSDLEAASESEEDDSDDESIADSEEDDDEEEDSEEEGKSWDELEAEARKADMERSKESDSEDERRRKKVKAAGIARARVFSGQVPLKKPKFR